MRQLSTTPQNRRTFLKEFSLAALTLSTAPLIVGCDKDQPAKTLHEVAPRPAQEVLEMTRDIVHATDAPLSLPKKYLPRSHLIKEGFTIISELGKKIDALDPENRLSLSERQSKIDSLCSEFWSTAIHYPFLKAGIEPFTRSAYEKYLLFTLPQIALEYGLYTHNTLRSFGTKFPLTNVTLISSFYELGTPDFSDAVRNGETISRAVVSVERFFGDNISPYENASRLSAIGGGGANAAYGHIFVYQSLLEDKRQAMLKNASNALAFIDQKNTTATAIIEELALETNEGTRLELAYRVTHAFALLSGMEPLNSLSAFQDYMVKGHEDFHIRGRPVIVDEGLNALVKSASSPHRILSVFQLIEERSAQIGEFCSGKYGAFGISDFILGALVNRKTDGESTNEVHIGNYDWIVSNAISIVLENMERYGISIIPNSPVPTATQVLVQLPIIAQSPDKLAMLEPELYKRTAHELLDVAKKMQ